MDSLYHKILERHLSKYFQGKPVSKEMKEFLNAISQSYYYYDRDRELLERAMELSSEELTQATIKARKELEQRLAAQEKILENEQILKSINENLREAIYRSSLEGNLIFTNLAFAELFGYNSIEESLQVPVHELYVYPADRANLIKRISKEGTVKSVEILFKKKDGEPFWGLVSTMISQDRYGNRYLDGAVIDITNQKKNEEMLKKTNDEMLKANQELQKINEELDHFVYSASHDLRAPLMSLLGLINLIKLENGKNVKEHLELMKKSIIKLDTFIHDIIDYSYNSRSIPEPAVIDFPQIIEESFEHFQYLPRAKHIVKHTEFSIEYPFYSDAKRLRVIVNNLISNAIKYHNAIEKNPYIKVRVITSKTSCRIDVEDNGMGIGHEHRDNIFKMFYRGTSYSPGSGLGLYIVKEVIGKLKGTITVESEPGTSTLFSISIPQMRMGVAEALSVEKNW